MIGVRALRDPGSVVSIIPTYSIALAILATYCLFVSITPQGTGEPINLCPLIATLSMPSLNPCGCGLSTKGRIIPLSASSAWM